MYAVVGTKKWPVESFAQVSAAYLKTIERMGIDSVRAPKCWIVDENDVIKAHVSCSGRIYPGTEIRLGVVPLYEPPSVR